MECAALLPDPAQALGQDTETANVLSPASLFVPPSAHSALRRLWFQTLVCVCRGRGQRNITPLNLNVISAPFIPNQPCSPCDPSLCHPDYRNLQNMWYSVFPSCPALTTRLRRRISTLRGAHGSAYKPGCVRRACALWRSIKQVSGCVSICSREGSDSPII